MTDCAPAKTDTTRAGDLAGLLGVKGVVTFFYYDDLASAIAFYERVIGLRKVLESEWCGLFELRPGTLLGLVDAVAGSQTPIAGRNKGAILSIETERLEACLALMKARGVAAQTAELELGCAGRTWEFKIHDPAGYCLEFFRWIEPPAG
jgi:hypothetical protein